jgi:hypothetical protein
LQVMGLWPLEVTMYALEPHPITGSPTAWARDLALLGGGTSLLLSMVLTGMVSSGAFPIWVGLASAAAGGSVGMVTPWVLDAVRGRVPLFVMALLAPVAGAVWGGGAGAVAGSIVGGENALLGLIAGAIAGGFQLGWWWFPYTVQTVRGGRTWLVMLGALAMLPVVAWVTFVGTLLTISFLGAASGLVI